MRINGYITHHSIEEPPFRLLSHPSYCFERRFASWKAIITCILITTVLISKAVANCLGARVLQLPTHLELLIILDLNKTSFRLYITPNYYIHRSDSECKVKLLDIRNDTLRQKGLVACVDCNSLRKRFRASILTELTSTVYWRIAIISIKTSATAHHPVSNAVLAER